MQLNQVRYFTLTDVLQNIPDATTENPTDIDEEQYKEELKQELKTTDREWLENHAGQCALFGHAAERVLYRIIKSSVGHPENSTAAANAITILKVMGISLSCLNFEGVHINGADLTGAILEGANFAGACLKSVILANAILNKVNFHKADLSEVVLGELPIFRHENEIFNWTITPDANFLFSTDFDNAYLWNLQKGILEKKIKLSDPKTRFSLSYLQNHIILKSEKVNKCTDNRSYSCCIFNKIELSTMALSTLEINFPDSYDSSDNMFLSPNGRVLLISKSFLRSPMPTFKYDLESIDDLKPEITQLSIQPIYTKDLSIKDIKFSPENTLIAIKPVFRKGIYIFDLVSGQFGTINVSSDISLDQLVFTSNEKHVILVEQNTLYIFDLWDSKKSVYDLNNIKKSTLFKESNVQSNIDHLQYIAECNCIIYSIKNPFLEIKILDIKAAIDGNKAIIASYPLEHISYDFKGIISYCEDKWLYIGVIERDKIKFFRSIKIEKNNSPSTQITSSEIKLADVERIFSVDQNMRSQCLLLFADRILGPKNAKLGIQIFGLEHISGEEITAEEIKDSEIKNLVRCFEAAILSPTPCLIDFNRLINVFIRSTYVLIYKNTHLVAVSRYTILTVSLLKDSEAGNNEINFNIGICKYRKIFDPAWWEDLEYYMRTTRDDLKNTVFKISHDRSFIAFYSKEKQKNNRLGYSNVKASIAIWDIEKEKFIDTVEFPTDETFKVFFGEDKNKEIFLMVRSRVDDSLRIWKLEDRERLRLIFQRPRRFESYCSIVDAVNVDETTKDIIKQNS